MTEAYDPTNVFARIIGGEIPSHKVFEDEACLVIMDAFPQVAGHTLVIPKAPSRNLLDADADALSGLLGLIQRTARAVKAATGAPGIRVMQFNEAPAGQTVFHLHFHIIPIYEGVPLKPHSGDMADQNQLAAQAEKIRALL